MSSLIVDLYGHQSWADAEQWRALESHAGALDDVRIRERLYHIHTVQRAFLKLVRGEPLTGFPKPEDFPTPSALRDYGRRTHEDAAAFLASIRAGQLAEPVVIPWAREPILEVTVEQALAQAATHSHYHRGQNATRLRELGGSPPVTDLILWYSKGRPAPDWS